MGRGTLKYRLHENHGFLNSPSHQCAGKNGLVERSTYVNQMLDDPSYISQGTLCFAYEYDKLFGKNNSLFSLFVAFEGVDSKKLKDFLGVERSLYKFFFA